MTSKVGVVIAMVAALMASAPSMGRFGHGFGGYGVSAGAPLFDVQLMSNGGGRGGGGGGEGNRIHLDADLAEYTGACGAAREALAFFKQLHQGYEREEQEGEEECDCDCDCGAAQTTRTTAAGEATGEQWVCMRVLVVAL